MPAVVEVVFTDLEPVLRFLGIVGGITERAHEMTGPEVQVELNRAFDRLAGEIGAARDQAT